MRKMENYLQLFRKVGGLKETDREGWKRVEIKEPESVADHSFRASFIGLMIGEKYGLNTSKILKFLLLHDVSEIITGDVTPEEDFTEKEKLNRERDALEQIFEGIDDKETFLELWEEFVRSESKEAKIANDIDKLEMALQAVEYGEKFPNKDFSEFTETAKESIETEEIKNLFEESVEHR